MAAAPALQALEIGKADEIRAFILLRLAGQIYWSPSSDLSDQGTPYRLCIYRDPSFFEEVRTLLNDRQIAGKPVQLLAIDALDELGQCHVAYVGEVSRADINSILSSGLLEQTVFVASSDYSAASGLHIRLYLGESDTFDIEINRSAFSLGGNEPSASFVKLAGKVYDHESDEGIVQ